MSGMVVDFVLLTYSASRDEGIDERGEAWTPEVSFEQGFGLKASCMSSGGGIMYGMGNGLSFMWGNIHAAFEV